MHALPSRLCSFFFASFLPALFLFTFFLTLFLQNTCDLLPPQVSESQKKGRNVRIWQVSNQLFYCITPSPSHLSPFFLFPFQVPVIQQKSKPFGYDFVCVLVLLVRFMQTKDQLHWVRGCQKKSTYQLPLSSAINKVIVLCVQLFPAILNMCAICFKQKQRTFNALLNS